MEGASAPQCPPWATRDPHTVDPHVWRAQGPPNTVIYPPHPPLCRESRSCAASSRAQEQAAKRASAEGWYRTWYGGPASGRGTRSGLCSYQASLLSSSGRRRPACSERGSRGKHTALRRTSAPSAGAGRARWCLLAGRGPRRGAGGRSSRADVHEERQVARQEGGCLARDWARTCATLAKRGYPSKSKLLRRYKRQSFLVFSILFFSLGRPSQCIYK